MDKMDSNLLLYASQRLRGLFAERIHGGSEKGSEVMRRRAKYTFSEMWVDGSRVAGEGEFKLIRHLRRLVKSCPETEELQHFRIVSGDSDIIAMGKGFYYQPLLLMF
jgi:hypothetical protein